jgi:thioesterase domain-containing protein/NRPS condensation-like uncharacterized protein
MNVCADPMRVRTDSELGFFASDQATAQSYCLPMSSGQLRVWFAEQLAKGTAVNNLYFSLHLTGEIKLASLDLSFRIVVDRHHALRTTFEMRDGKPIQLIGRTQPPALVLIDLSGRRPPDLADEAYALACREVNKPFDLMRGPLVRLVLLRLDLQEHIILVSFHHIICDGWSLRLFADELATCYAAFSRGESPELTPLPFQYGDYASWQAEWLGSQAFKRQLSFWIRKLSRAPMLLELSADGVRPTEPSFTGSRQTRRLPEHLVYQLKLLARRYNATPFATLLAVFQIVLCQYSGQHDVLVGMPIAGRNSVEFEDVIGLFANLVVVRTNLGGDPTFSKVLREVRNSIVDALANQDVPFERLVEALQPARSLAQNPIFQVLFASVKTAVPRKNFGDLKASPYIVEPSAVPFDLTLSSIEESRDTWWICADYRINLFTDDQIDRLLDHYLTLLSSVVERPEAQLSQLDTPPSWPVLSIARNRPSVLEAAVASSKTPAGFSAEVRAVLPVPGRRQSGDTAEEVLADLWAKVLGSQPPAASANFFDLGGHSLLAVHLASEISDAYKTNFPVSLIFQEPTIRGMAQCLRARLDAATSLVALQENGSLSPFFCGGSIREFLDLSRALGSDQPFFQLDIFALQQHRLFTSQPLYTSVSGLATRFLQDILSIQPRGPYFIGGMCEGGIIALELALQLQAQGREVALLAEFDTPVNGYWRKRPVDWVLHAGALIYSRRLIPRIREQIRDRMKPRVPMSLQEKSYLEILKVTWEGIRAYIPDRAFEGEIQIFRAPRPPTFFREDAAAGWHPRASKGIRVHDVIGDHFKLFCDPFSQRIIASVIGQAHRGLLSK